MSGISRRLLELNSKSQFEINREVRFYLHLLPLNCLGVVQSLHKGLHCACKRADDQRSTASVECVLPLVARALIDVQHLLSSGLAKAAGTGCRGS